MDAAINKLGLTLEESLPFFSLPLPFSPTGNCFILNRDNSFQLRFCQSSIDEPPVLSQSLTLNELEDLDNNAYTRLPNEKTRENTVFSQNKYPRIYVGGSLYNNNGLVMDDDLSFFNKRESMLSTPTTDFDVFTPDSHCSSAIVTESKVMVNLTVNESHFNGFKPEEIKAEKLDRRMTTFSLKKFNSFSWTSPLVSRMTTETTNQTNMEKLGKKITKKNPDSKSRVRKSKKNQSEKTLDGLMDTNSNHNTLSRSISVQDEDTVHKYDSSKKCYNINLKESLSDAPTGMNESNITMDKASLMDESSA